MTTESFTRTLPTHPPSPAPSSRRYVVTRWYRAPELLCESDLYGTPVDVWAVGCIFAEILGRRPLFKGANTREQLDLIIAKLGTPGPDDLRGITSKPVLDLLRRGPPKPAIPWTGA